MASIFGNAYTDDQDQWGSVLRIEGRVHITAASHAPYINNRGDPVSGSKIGPTVLRWGNNTNVGFEEVSPGLYHAVASGPSGNKLYAEFGQPYLQLTGSFTGSGGSELAQAKAAIANVAPYQVYNLGTSVTSSSPFLANTPSGGCTIAAFAITQTAAALSGSAPVPLTPTVDVEVPFVMVWTPFTVTPFTNGG